MSPEIEYALNKVISKWELPHNSEILLTKYTGVRI